MHRPYMGRFVFGGGFSLIVAVGARLGLVEEFLELHIEVMAAQVGG